MFVRRRQVRRAQARLRIPSADNAYRGILRGVNNLSADLTAAVQTGSLPNYLAVMLLTMVATGALVVIVGFTRTGPAALVGLTTQAVVSVLACVAAVLIVRPGGG